MKSLSTSLSTRLAAYAAGAAAIAITGATTTSDAAVVYVDLTPDLAVPQNSAGVYLDLVTGLTGVSGSTTPGYDINFYGTSALTFFRGTGTLLVSTVSATAAPSVLAPGTIIGGASTFLTSSSSATNFQVAGTELLGLRFTNTTTGVANFGWIELSTGAASTGFPATITRYAYENTGATIAAGAVPEPGTMAAVGLGLGALGLRAWRRRKQVA